MNQDEITTLSNGPLKVSGDNIVLKDANGREFDLGGRTVISLCRCGQSDDKPFCDGSHKDVGFESSPEARSLPSRG